MNFMSKKILLFLILILGLTSCVHTHTFSEKWSSDDNKHWHAATCEHTDEKQDLGDHEWIEGIINNPTCENSGLKVYTCKTCGQTKEESIAATGHSYDTNVWKGNGAKHWHECSCGAKTSEEEHTGGTATCEERAVCSVCHLSYGEYEEHNYGDLIPMVNKTCTNDGMAAHYQCSDCEKYFDTEKNEVSYDSLIITASHQYEAGYQSDDTNHWLECEICGDVSSLSTHEGGEATYGSGPICTICEKEYGDKLVLPIVSNINYEAGLLTFDGVAEATSYQVIIKKEDVEVFANNITETSLDLSEAGLAGSYQVEIYSRNGVYVSDDVATYSFTIFSIIEDIVIEAEIGLQAYANMYKANNLAHGGAYVGSIDNCGQGVTLDYFCYVAGEYEVDAYYMTGVEGAYHNVYVNGKKQARLDYSVVTGWGSSDAINTAKTSTTLTLEKGWNKIVVIKDGIEQDNWGGYAELDFFIVKGTGVTYNVDDYSEYNLIAPDKYRLEGEQASFINRVDSQWVFSNLVPFYSENASSKYMIGGIDAVGQGLEWHLNINRGGKYRVTVVYAYDVWHGGNYDVKLSFYHSNTHLRNFVMTNENLQQYKITDLQIDGVYQGWGVPVVNSTTFDIDLVEGDNFIYLTKELQDVYCQIDYIELTEIID